MENALMVAKIAGPIYLILGLSVLMYQQVWQKVVTQWQKDHFGLFAMMLMSMVLGLLVINLYNVWEWNVWLLITLTGWAMLVKGAAYFLLPGSVLKSIMNWAIKNKGLIVVDGLFALAIGICLSYQAYMLY